MIERRKHIRIVTLRNFGWFIVAALVVLGVMNAVSEIRAPRAREYGHPAPTRRTPSLEVIREGGADALVRPRDEVALTTGAPEQPQLDAAAWRTRASAAPQGITIVGDATGVSVNAHRKLRGGIFRQQ